MGTNWTVYNWYVLNSTLYNATKACCAKCSIHLIWRDSYHCSVVGLRYPKPVIPPQIPESMWQIWKITVSVKWSCGYQGESLKRWMVLEYIWMFLSIKTFSSLCGTLPSNVDLYAGRTSNSVMWHASTFYTF